MFFGVDEQAQQPNGLLVRQEQSRLLDQTNIPFAEGVRAHVSYDIRSCFFYTVVFGTQNRIIRWTER